MTFLEKALKILDTDGPLRHSLNHFEERQEQKQLLKDIVDAYENEKIALLEAGTGTGKSIAYLIPAILWATEKKQKTVISTHTINLQEQLLHKDLPVLKKVLGSDFEAVILKGMGNYLCLKRMNESLEEMDFSTSEEQLEVEKIKYLSDQTDVVSKSNLPMIPSPALWDKVCAENETCTFRKCPYRNKCSYVQARAQAQDAQIIIVNHHLLLADLVVRKERVSNDQPSILPDYQRLIIDEAHHLEDVASDTFASKMNWPILMKIVSRIMTEKEGKITGKVALLLEKLPSEQQDSHFLQSKLELELLSNRRQLLDNFDEFLESCLNFHQKFTSSNKKIEDTKLRLLPHHYEHQRWKTMVQSKGKKWIESVYLWSRTIEQVKNEVLKDRHVKEKAENLIHEIDAFLNRLYGICEDFDLFLSEYDASKVRWFELATKNFQLILTLANAELDVSKTLSQTLFEPLTTVCLLSATLSTHKNFTFTRSRLGIDHIEGNHIEKIYNSPFDFQNQVLLAVPDDLPLPNHSDFLVESSRCIQEAISISKGNAFVLFTSYSMLKACYNIIVKNCPYSFPFLKQGDDQRHRIIESFKSNPGSVLFGTDSFWEGIDISGDALQLVILVKLPFKVPSEPIVQARCEEIEKNLGDPFSHYSLPSAIMKFKQGFGRLIRSRSDRGAVICLDSRMINKSYGKAFLKSLPNCKEVFGSWNVVKSELEKQFIP